MKFRDSIRFAVVKSNSYRLFSRLNKAIYDFAVKIFILNCRKFSEIRKIYLKPSFGNSGWTPGLSDIDLIVIVNDNPGLHEEIVFLNNFWKNYNRLKFFFPMLGHVDIISEEQLKTLLKFKIEGYGFSSWDLRYSKNAHNLNDNISQRIPCQGSLFCAFDSYYNFLLKDLFLFSSSSPFIYKKLIIRITQKIISELGCKDLSLENAYFLNAYSSFAYVIKSLDRVKSAISCGGKRFSAYTEQKDGGNGHYPEKVKTLVEKLSERQGHCLEEVFFIDEFGKRPAVLFKDDLSAADISNFLSDLRGIILELDLPSPFIFTRNILRISLEKYNPFWYYGIGKGVLSGEDFRQEIKLPSNAAFTDCALRQSLGLFSAIRNQPQAQGLYSKRIFGAFSNYFIFKIVAMALFFEKGVIVISKEALLDKWKEYYHDSYSRFDCLNNDNRGEYCFIGKFTLAKELSDHLNKLIICSMK